MKNKKLLLLITISVSVLFILSGCSSAGISLSLSPNPIRFTEDKTSEELTLTVTTEGLGSISLDNLIVEVINEDDKVIFDEEQSINISDQFIVGGFSEKETYTLNLKNVFDPTKYGYDSDIAFSTFYNGYLKGKTHTLRITVTGSNNTSLTAQIIYN